MKELDPEITQMLDYLQTLYQSLLELGLENKITVDLGIVNHTDYYTGIVFKGYVEGYGEEILSGGRYDNLLKEFGSDLGAIGFAVNVDSAVKALLSTKQHQITSAEILVFSDQNYQVKALEHIAKLAELKITTEYSLFETMEDTLQYAKNKGIHRIDIVEEQIKTIQL